MGDGYRGRRKSYARFRDAEAEAAYQADQKAGGYVGKQTNLDGESVEDDQEA